jgi:hypothetical protein
MILKLTALVLSIAFLLWPIGVMAEDGWRDRDGKPIPDSSSLKSRDGFSAMLLVTPDKDWQEKWNTPPETAPSFTTAQDVEAGGELYILSFLANPGVDASGMANVTCDFVVIRPDGSKSTDTAGMDCFVTKLAGDPRSVYLSAASLKYVAEPDDQRGYWKVSITMRDNVKGVVIPLETSFTVK